MGTVIVVEHCVGVELHVSTVVHALSHFKCVYYNVMYGRVPVGLYLYVYTVIMKKNV